MLTRPAKGAIEGGQGHPAAAQPVRISPRSASADAGRCAVSDGNHLTSRCRTFAEILEIPAAEFDALQVTGVLQPATDACVPRAAEAFTWPLQPWSSLNGNGPASEYTYNFHRNFGVMTGAGVRSCHDTQRFQRRAVWSDTLKKHTWHLGGDFNCGTGSEDLGVPVHAVADGTVVYTGSPSGWGGVVMIRHETPWGSHVSGYFHVRWLSSGPPSGTVKRGQRIAEIGPTSTYSTAPHLHFELRRGTSTTLGGGYTDWQIAGGASGTGPQGQIDPIAFIAARRY
jgi:murein DD-endopeptidase MepM/ murein hydrolase activator NlpD